MKYHGLVPLQCESVVEWIVHLGRGASGGSRGESGPVPPSRSKIIKIHGIIIGSHTCNATFDTTSGLHKKSKATLRRPFTRVTGVVIVVLRIQYEFPYNTPTDRVLLRGESTFLRTSTRPLRSIDRLSSVRTPVSISTTPGYSVVVDWYNPSLSSITV